MVMAAIEWLMLQVFLALACSACLSSVPVRRACSTCLPSLLVCLRSFQVNHSLSHLCFFVASAPAAYFPIHPGKPFCFCLPPFLTLSLLLKTALPSTLQNLFTMSSPPSPNLFGSPFSAEMDSPENLFRNLDVWCGWSSEPTATITVSFDVEVRRMTTHKASGIGDLILILWL